MNARAARAVGTGLVAIALAVTGCASSTATTGTTAAAATSVRPSAVTTSPTVGSTAPTAEAITPATEAPADTVSPVGGRTAICTGVPSLDEINAVLDEPVTTLTELPRGADESTCEATGDGTSSVQFDVLRGVTEQAMRDQAVKVGATVSDLAEPAGGFVYAATAVKVIDGTAYSVQALTLDTITDPNTAEATLRSAGLLSRWLARLGLT